MVSHERDETRRRSQNRTQLNVAIVKPLSTETVVSEITNKLLNETERKNTRETSFLLSHLLAEASSHN